MTARLRMKMGQDKKAILDAQCEFIPKARRSLKSSSTENNMSEYCNICAMVKKKKKD